MSRGSLLLFAVLWSALLVAPLARSQDALPILQPIFTSPSIPEPPAPNPCFVFGCFDGSDLDGDTLAVRGADYAALYVYVREDSGSFVFQTYVDNPDMPEPTPEQPDPGRNDLAFGRPFLLRGNELLVASGTRVLVFRRWGKAWLRVQTLPFPGARVTTLAHDRGTLLAGSKDNNTVRVFRQGRWGYYHLEATLPGPSASGTEFAAALAIDGDTALVGAPAESNRAGAVYVYQRHWGWWRLMQKLTPPAQLAATAQFGAALTIEGFELAVGAPTAAGADVARSGFVQLYSRTGWVWQPGQRIPNPIPLTDPNSRQFGNALALERGRLLAAGYAYTPLSNGEPTAFLFDRRSGEFVPTARFPVDAARYFRFSGREALLDVAGFRFGSTPQIYELPPRSR